MAFILKRPFAITATVRQSTKPVQSTLRSFHSSPLKQKQNAFFHQQTYKAQPAVLSKSRNVFQATFKRHYTPPSTPSIGVNTGDLRQRLMYGAGIFGGTLLAINLIFNRETREDGGMPPFERKYLNDTFMHTGLGLGTIAIAARTLHMNGWSYRLMAANPWLVLGVGLAGSIGTMIATRATDPDKSVGPLFFG
jgi:hypothetical protein